MRQVAAFIAVVSILASSGGCASKAGSGYTPPPDGGVTIAFVDPVDDQIITTLDDLNTDAEDHVQYTVACQTTGLEAGTRIDLHVHHDTWGGDWDYSADTDDSGTVSFTPVTFWEGSAEEPSEYTLVARTADGAVESPTISIRIEPTVDGVTAFDEPAEWEVDCTRCEADEECDDGLTCPSREACGYSTYALRKCCYSVTLDCSTADACLTGTCSEEMGGCVYGPRDADGDGHADIDCGYDDCDDDSYAIHPGAREICDTLDNDCDGAINEDSWVPTGDPLVLTSPGEEPYSPTLASGDSSWGVAWIASLSTGTEARAGVITPGITGPTATTSTVAMTTPAGFVPTDAAIVPHGDGFLLFLVGPHYESQGIVGLEVSPTGAISSTGTWVLVLAAPILDLTAVEDPATGSIGIFLRSTVELDYEIFFLDVSWPPPWIAAGEDLHRVTESIGFSGWPSAAARSGGFAVAWEDSRDGNAEIYFRLLDPTGLVSGPERRVTSSPGASQNVALASSADGFALAWMDSRAGGYDLLFTCLATDGSRSCPEIGMGEGPEVSWYPSLVFQGYPGQFALAYAGREDGLFKTRATAVPIASTVRPSEIEAGASLSAGAVSVSSTAIADAGFEPDIYRGVLWAESTTGGPSSLDFVQLSCE